MCPWSRAEKLSGRKLHTGLGRLRRVNCGHADAWILRVNVRMTLLDAARNRFNALKYKMLYKGGLAGALWENYEPHPPLVELLDRDMVTIGRALDVGCGLGTQSIYLAERGFAVDGIDFQENALARARTRASAASANCRFEWADVTQASSRDPYDLIIDHGCFHNLGGGARHRYSQNLQRWLAPAGYFQLSAFVWEHLLERLTPVFIQRVPAADIEGLFSSLELVETKQVMEREFGVPKMFCYLFRASRRQ